MANLKELVDEYAQYSDFTRNVENILKFERWTGDNPILMLADAAGTTGQNCLCGIPSPELQINESEETSIQCGHVFDTTPWIESAYTSRHA